MQVQDRSSYEPFLYHRLFFLHCHKYFYPLRLYNQNHQEENELPSQEEVYANSENNNNNNNSNNNNQQYPSHGMEGLNGVINNQPQQGGKYFGFWGPSLERNPNQPNNNGQ